MISEQWIRRKWLLLSVRYYPDFGLKGLNTTSKSRRQHSQSPGRELNSRILHNSSSVTSPQRRCSVTGRLKILKTGTANFPYKCCNSKWWWWSSSSSWSCQWSETTPLNCGHPLAYCSSAGDIRAWRSMAEWYLQEETPDSSIRTFWQTYQQSNLVAKQERLDE